MKQFTAGRMAEPLVTDPYMIDLVTGMLTNFSTGTAATPLKHHSNTSQTPLQHHYTTTPIPNCCSVHHTAAIQNPIALHQATARQLLVQYQASTTSRPQRQTAPLQKLFQSNNTTSPKIFYTRTPLTHPIHRKCNTTPTPHFYRK